jgi:osmotically-inducible protein OsmY
MKTDTQLHQDVLAELMWDPQVKEKEIGVACKDGVVTLTGSVDSFAEKWAAERAAERVIGVRAVAADLVVTIPSAFSRTDTELAHKAVDALMWDIQIPDYRIRCKVSDGWITLDGDVDWQYQRDAAARDVRNLTGVRGVTNTIRVLPKRVSAYDVTRNIRKALERRADRTAEHINVFTKDGVVTLTGTVSSFGERRAAEGAAWSAPGVAEVRDELAVAF